MENYYIKKTDNFITVSRWIKEKLPKEKNIFVVHNGIDTKRFKRGKKIKNDMPVILYTGRLMAMKGIYILMKAMKDILKKVDAQFIFAGTGNIKKFEKRLKGVDKKYYRFLGYVDYEKIHKLYSSSDVFVLPSLSESSPLSILEAMGCEVGVVASNVGGVPEIINDRKNGMLVEAENAKQLSEKLIYMIENEQVRKKISLNGRKLVEKKFNADIMAKNTKEVYEKILG